MSNMHKKIIVPKGSNPTSLGGGINVIKSGLGSYTITHNPKHKYKEYRTVSVGQYWKSDRDDHVIKILDFDEDSGYAYEEVESGLGRMFESAGDIIDNYTHMPLYDSPLYKAMSEDE